MSSSLPSYDLARLFCHYSHYTRDSGGEALVEEVGSSRDLSSASEGDNLVMTDSLSALSWDEITEDQEDYDNDGDDESRD